MPCPRLDLAREYWRHDEGALLDIYVDRVDASERQAVLEAVLELGWEWSYSDGGVERSLRPDEHPLLASTFFVGRRLAAAPRPGFWFHWWLHEEEVELDVDPRDIATQDELDCVCELVRAVGRSIERQVFAGIEYARTAPLLWYEPDTDDIVVADLPEPAPPALWTRVLRSVQRRGR